MGDGRQQRHPDPLLDARTDEVVRAVAVGNEPERRPCSGGRLRVVDPPRTRCSGSTPRPTAPRGRSSCARTACGQLGRRNRRRRWVTGFGNASVFRIDPFDRREVVATISGGQTPPPGGRHRHLPVRVANQNDGTLSRIDPASDAVVATVPVAIPSPRAGRRLPPPCGSPTSPPRLTVTAVDPEGWGPTRAGDRRRPLPQTERLIDTGASDGCGHPRSTSTTALRTTTRGTPTGGLRGPEPGPLGTPRTSWVVSRHGTSRSSRATTPFFCRRRAPGRRPHVDHLHGRPRAQQQPHVSEGFTPEEGDGPADHIREGESRHRGGDREPGRGRLRAGVRHPRAADRDRRDDGARPRGARAPLRLVRRDDGRRRHTDPDVPQLQCAAAWPSAKVHGDARSLIDERRKVPATTSSAP